MRCYVDDRLVRTVRQSITYPLQLMIDLFEFPVGTTRYDGDYPKTAEIEAVRGYEWRRNRPGDPQPTAAQVASGLDGSTRPSGRDR